MQNGLEENKTEGGDEFASSQKDGITGSSGYISGAILAAVTNPDILVAKQNRRLFLLYRPVQRGVPGLHGAFLTVVISSGCCNKIP